VSLEAVYIIRETATVDTVAASLAVLLPVQHRPIRAQRSTLLDTFDFRLQRAGASLARSGANGSAVVSWHPGTGPALLSRPANGSLGFVWDLPDGALRRAVMPVAGVRRLLEQADVDWYGSRLDVLDDRGKTVARLRIESGRARPSVPGVTWRPLPVVITVTGLRGYDEAYRQLLPLVESRPGVAPSPGRFHDVVLREVGIAERMSPHLPIALSPSIAATVGARQVQLALANVIEANEPGVRARIDTEFLHDYRVAVRRTRSLLGQIRGVFSAEMAAHFATEFSWLGQLTGPPRDLDVLALALRGEQDGISTADMHAVRLLLDDRRQRAHAALVDALNGDRYRRLLPEWRGFLQQSDLPGAEAVNANRALSDVMAARARRLSRKIARTALAIDAGSPAATLHDVRIAAKKLRYLVDVTPGFYADADLTCVLRALKTLQRVLGEFNDAHVQEQWLLECGRMPSVDGKPALRSALARLADLRRQCGERLRAEVVGGLAGFLARDTRRACKRAFKRPASEEQPQ
jgi:CHAD domain-containing protein